VVPAFSHSIARRTNQDRDGGLPPTTSEHPRNETGGINGRNEVEMHRPKISRETVGKLDKDPCRDND